MTRLLKVLSNQSKLPKLAERAAAIRKLRELRLASAPVQKPVAAHGRGYPIQNRNCFRGKD